MKRALLLLALSACSAMPPVFVTDLPDGTNNLLDRSTPITTPHPEEIAERFTATIVFDIVNIRWMNGDVYEQVAYGDRIDVACFPPEGGWCRIVDPDYDAGLRLWRGCTDRPLGYYREAK